MCSEVSKIQKPCNNIIDVALSAGKQMFRFNKKNSVPNKHKLQNVLTDWKWLATTHKTCNLVLDQKKVSELGPHHFLIQFSSAIVLFLFRVIDALTVVVVVQTAKTHLRIWSLSNRQTNRERVRAIDRQLFLGCKLISCRSLGSSFLAALSLANLPIHCNVTKWEREDEGVNWSDSRHESTVKHRQTDQSALYIIIIIIIILISITTTTCQAEWKVMCQQGLCQSSLSQSVLSTFSVYDIFWPFTN